MTTVRNDHCAYVVTGVATQEQIRNSINMAVVEYNKRVDPSEQIPRSPFMINIVKGRPRNDSKGPEISYGYAYVWFMNKKMARLICGLNPDGTERVEEIDDPNWSPQKETTTTTSDRWADWCDEEDQTVCPKIRNHLPTLMPVPPYKYTEEQMQRVKEIIEKSPGESSMNPEEGFLEFSMACAKPIPPNYVPNVIHSRNLPSWVTEEQLKQMFQPFVSNKNSKYTVVGHDGKKIRESYPKVTIEMSTKGSRIGYVEFEPRSFDANFALLMMTKTTLTKSVGGESVQVVFSHPWKDRRHDRS